MSLETAIAEVVHVLPLAEQAKVLEFAKDLKFEQTNGQAKSSEPQPVLKSKSKRFSFAGIGRSKTGDISIRAEEILAAEIDKRSGWTVKDERID